MSEFSFRIIKIISVLLAFQLVLSCAQAEENQGLDLRGRVKKFTLDNGMKVLLLKREGAPVFAADVFFDVGTIDSPEGATGFAHFFEHMAFKGTDKIGTKDFAKEKVILDEVLKVGTQIAEMKRAGNPPEDYAELIEKRQELEAKQREYIVTNEFYNILVRNGANDLNAGTSYDNTLYYASMPSHKLELWAYLESERYLNGVYREFFTEVDVVAEERRMSVDNDPDGRMYEAFVTTAFRKSPYRLVSIGLPEHIQAYTPQQADEFKSKYYVPSRMTLAIVGNFDLDKTQRIVRNYFGKLPKGNGVVSKKFPVEDFSDGKPRVKTFYDDIPARFYLGYHRPAFPHPDDAVLEVIESILCEGLSSRISKELVQEKQIVANYECETAFPGDRLDSVFTFMAVPMDGHGNAEAQDAIRKIISQLAVEGPTEQELKTVKNTIDADIIYSLESNPGLAGILSYYEGMTGDWENLYRLRDDLHRVTADDVKRVLKTYFIPAREVVVNQEKKS